MRAYATMEEMENYIRRGKDNFIKIIGGKTMGYKKFIEKLDRASDRFFEFPHEKLGTKKGKQIVDDMCTYWAVSILVQSTLFANRPLSRDSVEFMYNNYDKERALRIFDSNGYKFYMQQKEGQKDTPTQAENEQIVKYDNDNYTELE